MPPIAKLPSNSPHAETLGLRIKKRRRLLAVSGALLFIAVGDFLILRGAGDIEPPLIRGWRLFLTFLLVFFLARGSGAARWLTVILTALGALGGFVAISVVTVTGVLGPGFRYLLLWFGFVTVAYALISTFLAFSPGVSREIRRIENDTKL